MRWRSGTHLFYHENMFHRIGYVDINMKSKLPKYRNVVGYYDRFETVDIRYLSLFQYKYKFNELIDISCLKNYIEKELL